MLQCVAVCCSVLQCVAVCCIVLQIVRDTLRSSMISSRSEYVPPPSITERVVVHVAVYCSVVLQYVAACCSSSSSHRESVPPPSIIVCMVVCVAVCCSVVLQCVAVCCSVLQLELFTQRIRASSQHHCVAVCVAVCCVVLQCVVH